MWTARAVNGSPAARRATSYGPPPVSTGAHFGGYGVEGVEAGRQLHVAVTVYPGHLDLEPAVLPPAHRGREAYQRLGVNRAPEVSDVTAVRQKRGRGCENVAAGEGRPRGSQLVGGVHQVHDRPRPAPLIDRRRQQAIVRADKRQFGSAGPDGDGPPSGAHAGVDDSHRHPFGQVGSGPLQGQAARPHVLRRHLMGEVDDRDLG